MLLDKYITFVLNLLDYNNLYYIIVSVNNTIHNPVCSNQSTDHMQFTFKLLSTYYTDVNHLNRRLQDTLLQKKFRNDCSNQVI